LRLVKGGKEDRAANDDVEQPASERPEADKEMPQGEAPEAEPERNPRLEKQQALLPGILDELNGLRNELGPRGRQEDAVALLEAKVPGWITRLNGAEVEGSLVEESWGRAAETVLEQDLLAEVDGKDLVAQLNLAQQERDQVIKDLADKQAALEQIEGSGP